MTQPVAPPYMQYGPPPPATKRGNALGVAGFVIALLSLVLGVIPLANYVAFGLAPIALVFCVIALVLRNRRKGLAVTGVILAVLALGAATLWAVGISHATKAMSTPKAVTATIGQTARAGDFTFAVHTFRCGVASVGGGLQKPQGQYCIVSLTVKNVGTSSGSLQDTSQTLVDAGGAKYEADSFADGYLPGANSLFTDINPGNQVSAQMAFDVPKSFKASYLNLRPGYGFLTGGVNVKLP